MKAVIRRHGRASAAAFVMLAFLAGCSTPPDKIILLPDPEGKVGAVIVHSATGQQTIDKAYAGVDVTKSGSIEKTMDSEAVVQTRYGELLAARPPRPMTFTVFFLFDSATAHDQRVSDQAARPSGAQWLFLRAGSD